MDTHFKTIIFVAGIVLGIVAGFVSPFASEIAVAALLLAVTQATVLLVERRELRGKSDRKTEGFSIALLTILFSIGVSLGAIRVQLVEEKIPYTCSTPCAFEGTIISSPEKKDAYQTFVVRPLDREENSYDVQLRVPIYPAHAIGETVRVSGKMTEPSAIFPHDGARPFDYVSYLTTKNVGSEMFFPKVGKIESNDITLVASLGRWKENFVARINMYVSSPASSLASGMLFGNSSMSKELTDTFRTAGLSHIIVLSGFNIAIVIAFILFVFGFLPLVIRILLASLSVILFVVMVGGEASVIRATLMSFVGLLALFLGREYVARQALVLSFLAIVMYEPQSLLHDVSLHLSFLATAGIVYGSEYIKIFVQRFLSGTFFVELLTTTLAAYFATLPFVMYTFGMVSVYALLANILALPFVPLAMLFSFLVVLTSYVSHTLALMIGYATSFLIDIILFVASAVSRLPLSSFSLSISFAVMCVSYVVIVVTLGYFLHRRKNETPDRFEKGNLTDIIPY